MASIGSHRVTDSWFSNVRPAPRHLVSTFSGCDLVDAGAFHGLLTSSVGKQSYTDLNFFFASSEITNMVNVCNLQFSQLQGVTNWASQGGPPVVLNIPTNRALMEYIYLRSAKAEYQFKNFSNTQCTMLIYDWVYRQDSDTIEANDGGSSISVVPTNLIVAGVELATGVADESGTLTQAWSTLPHIAHQTTRPFLKCKKISKVVLEPGEMHRHHVFIAPHHTFPAYKLRSNSLDNTMKWGGLTHVVTVCLMGSPCLATGGTDTTVNAAEVGWIMRVEYRFRSLPAGMQQFYVTNGASSLATTTSVTPIINPDTGAASALVNPS